MNYNFKTYGIVVVYPCLHRLPDRRFPKSTRGFVYYRPNYRINYQQTIRQSYEKSTIFRKRAAQRTITKLNTMYNRKVIITVFYIVFGLVRMNCEY
jgi:hypothetical protein